MCETLAKERGADTISRSICTNSLLYRPATTPTPRNSPMALETSAPAPHCATHRACMQTVINNPVAGTYAIEVTSVAIAPNEGGQKFSVVALGGVSSGSKGQQTQRPDDEVRCCLLLLKIEAGLNRSWTNKNHCVWQCCTKDKWQNDNQLARPPVLSARVVVKQPF